MKKSKNTKFSFRVFFTLFFSFLIIITLIVSSLYVATKRSNTKLYQKQIKSIENTLSDNLQNLLYRTEHSIKHLDQNQNITNDSVNDSELIYQSIYKTLHENRINGELTVLNDNLEPILSTSETIMSHYDKAVDDWGIKRTMTSTSKESFFHYIQHDSPELPRLSSITIGFKNQNNNYILIDLESDFVKKELTHNLNYSGEFYIKVTDKHGTILLENDSNIYQYYENNKIKTTLVQESFYITIVHTTDFLDNLNKCLKRLYLMIITIVFFICFFVSKFVTTQINRPIKYLLNLTRKINKGDLSHYETINQPSEIKIIVENFNNLLNEINNLIEINNQNQKTIYIGQLKNLQAQIKPHFIYNVLNTISFIAKLNGINEISEIVTSLSKILRSNINNQELEESISDSLEIIDSYLTIQNYRYYDKFSYFIYCDSDAQNITIPKLLIQPLVENAFEHGIEDIDKKGKILISIVLTDELLIIAVEDNGPGITHDPLTECNKEQKSDSNQIAIKNIKERLQHTYNENFQFNIKNTGGTTAWIIIKRSVLNV